MTPPAASAAVLRSVASAGCARIGRPRPVESHPVDLPGAPDAMEAARAQGHAQGHLEGQVLGREEGRRAGFAQGLEQGMVQGKSLGSASLASAIAEATGALRQREQQLQRLADALQADARSHLQAAEDELVAVCFETLVRILGPALVTPQGVRAQALALLERCGAGVPVSVHVHPDDAALLAHLETPDRSIAWRADPAVQRGGCRVRHAGGELDARLETVLDQVRTALLEARTATGVPG